MKMVHVVVDLLDVSESGTTILLISTKPATEYDKGIPHILCIDLKYIVQPYNFACFHANRCAVEINWSNGIYGYNWLLSADEIGTSIRKFTCLGWLIWLSACKEWYFCFSRAKKDEEYCCHAILPRRTSLHTCSQAGLKLDHRETRSFFFLIFTPLRLSISLTNDKHIRTIVWLNIFEMDQLALFTHEILMRLTIPAIPE